MLVSSCVLAGTAFAACGGAGSTKLANGTVITPADKSVCAAVNQAFTDIQTKNYSQWRAENDAISQMDPDNASLKNLVHLDQTELAESRSRNTNRGLVLNLGPLNSLVRMRQLCESWGQ
jgi:hypothetical protein